MPKENVMHVAAWEIDEQELPHRLQPDRSYLERHLESWLENEPTLLSPGLEVVARQLVLPDGSRLDLLGLNPEDRWVIVELKQGSVTTGTIAQALHYFLELGGMTNAELHQRLVGRHLEAGSELADRVQRLTGSDEEASDRDYRLIVAGGGAGDSAEAAAATLARAGFSIPVTVISFQIIESEGGRPILIREMDEEGSSGTGSSSTASSDSLIALCDDCGVRSEMNSIQQLMADLGFGEHRRRTGLNFNSGARKQLFWVTPTPRQIRIGYILENFPTLLNVDEATVELEFGDNWITLPPSDAVDRMRQWAEQAARWRDTGEGVPAG